MKAALLYLGCGFMCLAFFGGPGTNWTSPDTYGWILGWPIGLFILFLKWFLIAGGIVAVIILAIDSWETRP